MMNASSSPITIYDAAVWYASLGLKPVPLYGIRPDGRCTCDDPSCPERSWGKHPIGKRWQVDATSDVDVVRDRFRGHTGNIGIVIGGTDLIALDADGEQGVRDLGALELPDTMSAVSGSGQGKHCVLRLGVNMDPTKITDRRIPHTQIDIKKKGQIVVAPSMHRSGKCYEWLTTDTIADLPQHVYDLITARSSRSLPAAAPTEPVVRADDRMKRARDYIATMPESISGSRGHDALFRVAAKLIKGFELSDDEARDLIVRDFNPRCKPPWSEKEIEHKISEAHKATAFGPVPDRDRPGPMLRVVASNGSAATGSAPPPPSSSYEKTWKARLRTRDTKYGTKILEDVDNLVTILSNDERVRGAIARDTFSGRIIRSSNIVYDEDMGDGTTWTQAFTVPNRTDNSWTDTDTTILQAWLIRVWGLRASVAVASQAVETAADMNQCHAVRDYLTSLRWDGSRRLKTWLADFMGAERSEYTEKVGTWWLASAVARVMRPGCKVDTMIVLSGPQGRGKSSILEALASAEWFHDTGFDIRSKDAHQILQGKWIIEDSELESLGKADATKAKAFLTSRVDRYRPPYARHEIARPRQCVFAGTTNQDVYLHDMSGGRRFLPVRTSRLDVSGVLAARDQLWAEALAYVESGGTWWPQTDEDRAMFATEQEHVQVVHPWETTLIEKLRPTYETTTKQCLDLLGLDNSKQDRAAAMRVGGILRRIGFVARRQSHGFLYQRSGEP